MLQVTAQVHYTAGLSCFTPSHVLLGVNSYDLVIIYEMSAFHTCLLFGSPRAERACGVTRFDFVAFILETGKQSPQESSLRALSHRLYKQFNV